jgi:hypothetical protein
MPNGACPSPLTRRSFAGALAWTLGGIGLQGCGGGGSAQATGAGDGPVVTPAATPPAPAPTPTPTPTPAPAPTPAPPAGANAYAAYDAAAGAALPTISIAAGAAGTWPYTCALLPLPGQLPAGSVFTSPDDPALALSILGTWPDGSAALAVASGTVTTTRAGATKTLQLQPVSAGTAAPLTASSIAAQVQSMAVDLGAYGVAQITDLANPERIWWANAQTICARYRAGVSGHATLEAVFDVQAFAGNFAFVEVVVENCKMDTAAPVAPAWAGYTAAVFSVNGRAVATVNSAGAAEGAHSPFRAWYASAWVGADPGLRAVQDTASLQRHPLFWKMDQAGSSMSSWAADAYTPWGAGRQRGVGMGAGGDHPSIGPLPQWEAQFVQTGDPRAASAVEASALSTLGFNVNYRDAGTGRVPTLAELAGKTQQSNWPTQTNGTEAMTWEVAHHPAAGLTAFVCRPSPVFIEIAQKVAVFNATYTTYQDVGPTTATGVFGQYYQMRGRAWCLRSLTHATFLTPAGMPWRAAGIASLAANAAFLDGWRTDARARLNCFWDYAFGNGTLQDADSGAAGFQSKVWQHHYLTTELHRAAVLKLLNGSAQATLEALADWAALQPVRWINEQANGAWRYVPYHTTIGRSTTSIDSLGTWDAQLAWSMTDAPASVSGPWKTDYSGDTRTTYASFGTTDTAAGAGYPSYLWSALVVAVERGLPGSRTAWETVQANVTDLSSWRNGFAGDPRWGASPRNI